MSEPPITIRVDAHHTLSAFQPGDTAALVQYLNDAEIYANSLTIPSPYHASDAERFLESAAEAQQQYGHPIHFAIRDPDHELLGGIGFQDFFPEHRGEIGYWLARPVWGRGIMTRSVGAFCAYAMEHWQLVRISARVFVGNERSCQVLERNGFQEEGILRSLERKNGRLIDCHVFALLRSDS